MWRIALIFLSAVLLGGCASHAPDSARPTAWLRPGVRVTPPPPGIAPAQQQLLTGEVRGKSESLLVLLSANGEKIELAGLSSVGIRQHAFGY